MSKRAFFIIIFSVAAAGCSAHRPVSALHSRDTTLTEARVFQKDKLIKGGNLLIVPFSAGEGVEASDELDHVSLMIVKGIADTLGDQGRSFKILTEENAQSADFVIKGRIVRMQAKETFHEPWRKNKSVYSLGIEGSVMSVDPEEILAKFAQDDTNKSRSNSYASLGYELGVKIGRFLVSSAGKTEGAGVRQ